MSAPANFVSVQGTGVVSGDNLNTLVQWCPDVATLRSFIALTNMSVFLLGYTAAGDGGQGNFYYSPTSTATDDGGVTAVVPTGNTTGAWLRLPSVGTGTILGGVLQSANMNLTTDQPIPIVSPTPAYRIESIIVTNPSTSLTTAAGGLYTAVSKGGVAIVANTQVYSGLTVATRNASGSLIILTLAANLALNLSAIYLSLTTGQGAAATADFYVFIQPLKLFTS